MRLKPLLILLSAFLPTTIGMRAADPTLPFEGNGTQASPYLLKSGADIKTLADACAGEAGATTGVPAGHYSGKWFALANDIDMSGVSGFYGIGTAPMGSASGLSWYFGGRLDGRGHTIRNMKIEGIVYDSEGKGLASGKTGSRGYVGLIGTLKEGGRVDNVNLDASCTVSGYTSVGGIVGQLEATASISNCTSAAEIYSLHRNSGGVVGFVNGSQAAPATVFGCVFTGTVRNGYESGAGIAGRNVRGVVSKCVNLGNVSLQAFNTASTPDRQTYGAGIVAYNQYGIVENCLNAGAVSVSYQTAGGIVGYNANADASVSGCVNLGPVLTTDKQYSGAIVGRNFRSGSASAYNYGKISDCYYDAQMWGDPEALRGYQVIDGMVTALPTASFTTATALDGLPAAHWKYEAGFYPRPDLEAEQEVIRRAAATYLLFPADQTATDFHTSAKISTAMSGITATLSSSKSFDVSGGYVNALPVTEIANDTVTLVNGTYRLRVPLMNVPKMFKGEGTAESPYLIGSASDLMMLATLCNSDRTEHFVGCHFLQTTDIDMQSEPAFKGIASKNINAFNSERTYYFSGHYDGGGHRISNICIQAVTFQPGGTANDYTKGSTGNVGLFGALGQGAMIENVNISNSSITGYYNVGGVTGYLPDNAEIRNCRVEADIVCYNRMAGGIAGQSEAASGSLDIKITDCLFRGSVRANSEKAGGIIGNNHAVVSGCVNLGSVTVSGFNDCVPAKNISAGGIAGTNCGNIDGCLNMGNITAAWTQAGGIAGENTNGHRKGNLTANISLGQVSAADLTYAGAIIGLDYRVSTSVSSTIVMEDNYYDSTVIGLLASENSDKEGLSATTTDALTAGNQLIAPASKWDFTKGCLPVPASFREDEMMRRAASIYIITDEPWTLYNFGSEASLATTIPLSAVLTAPSEVFAIEGNRITAGATQSIARTTIAISNGDYTRELLLTKTGAILPGQGTQTDPYLISTAQDMLKVADYVATNRFDFAGYYFRVSSDIDFTSTGYRQIGSAATYFNGTIDGAGHTLSGIRVDARGSENSSAVGMISYLGQLGRVANLRIASSSFDGESQVGAFVGCSHGVIENCETGKTVSVTATLSQTGGSTSGNEAGGIAGRAFPSAKFIDCVSRARVSANKMAGGIVGGSRDELGTMISGCVNEGEVVANAPRETVIQGGQEINRSVEAMAGGIAGRFTGSITRSVNRGSVSTSVCDAVGGIVGKAFIHTEINRCINEGNVTTANSYAGGIVGISTVMTGTEVHTLIDSCVNYGTVKGISSVGGIAGVGANGLRVTASANCGTISPMMGRAGGIVGEISRQVEIFDSYNTGEITASMLAGGIAGDAPTGSKLTVKRCFNAGAVRSGANGGASGIVNSTGGTNIVADCYNRGDIASARFAAGIAGRADGLTIERCYSAANVQCTSANSTNLGTIGSIIGDIKAADNVISCCYLKPAEALSADSYIPRAKAMSVAEIASGESVLGESYIYNPVCMPMLRTLASADAAKANAVYFVATDASATPSAGNPVQLGQLEGVVWSVSGDASLDGDKAVPSGIDGSMLITATAGDFSRSYEIGFGSRDGIADIFDDDGTVIAEVTYHTMDGRLVKSPAKGDILVRTVIMTDGRRHSEVIVY